MVVGITLFIVAVLIAAIWIIVEVKRLRHKVFALFLIALVLFTYVSFSVTLKDQDLDLTTVAGFITAGKFYFSWLVSVFGNLKVITAQVVGMDWKVDNSSIK